MCQGSLHGSTLDAFTSSQDSHGGSCPNLKYKKLIHFLKGEWHTSLRHTKNVCQLLLQPPEPDPQTGHHEQMVFKGHHCQPTSTSHVLPASFHVSSTLWLRIFSFNSIPNAFQRAFHWTTDNPEMNPSANRRFLSRSQKRVWESATFELAFSHSRRQVDAPFLPHVSCVPRSAFLLPQALRELVSPSDWAAAAAAPASAMASCFFSLISRARSAPDARRSISAQRGARRWQRQDQWFGEKVVTVSRRFRTTDQSFSVISEVFLHTFQWVFCMRSALATAWQPSACPLANPDNNR